MRNSTRLRGANTESDRIDRNRRTTAAAAGGKGEKGMSGIEPVGLTQ